VGLFTQKASNFIYKPGWTDAGFSSAGGKTGLKMPKVSNRLFSDN